MSFSEPTLTLPTLTPLVGSLYTTLSVYVEAPECDSRDSRGEFRTEGGDMDLTTK